MKDKIIIIGYPKSGNTWLTRLTAELTNSPVKGFLYSNHNEIAVEGLDRNSDFEVYKSHHQINEIREEDLTSSKIIYIVRDPRDVSISGRNFFEISKNVFHLKPILNINQTTRLTYRIKIILNKLFEIIVLRNRRKSIMEKAVLSGDKRVHYWCRVSWGIHVTPFLNDSNILLIKYESLLENPLKECKRILQYLNVEKKEAEIKNAISNQSFDKKKNNFKEKGDLDKYIFMKNGKKQQFKKVMSKKENKRYVNTFKNLLTELGYDLEI